MTDTSLRVVLTAQDRTSGAFSRLRGQIQGLQGQAGALQSSFAGILGPLAAGASLAGLVGLTRSVVNGLDALNDLKDATGASIENLSALEDIALRTGTGIDTVGSALVKMNQVLANAKPGSDAAAAIQAIGLSVSDLKQQDPAEALRRIAVALSKFADDGNKARLVQELFGKSIREVAPLLNDLAEAGELNARVSTEQALAAERFNKNLAALQKNATDLARTLAGPVVSSVNELFSVLKGEGAGELDRKLAVPLQAITVLGANVAFVLKGIGNEIGGIAAQAAAVARLDFAGAARIGDMMREDAKAAREEFDKLERRLLSIGANAQAAYSNEGRNYQGPGRASVPAIPDTAEIKKAADARRKLAEEAARAIVDVEEQAAADAAEAWKFWEAQQLDSAKVRADALKEQWQQVFDFIDQQQDEEIERGRQYLETLGKESQDLAKDIGLVFASAAGEAITNWQGVKGLLKGILQDIAQIALKKTVTDPLGKAVGGFLDGFSFGDIFKSIGAALPKFATGTPYVPQDMVAMIHKGERIVPADQNRAGYGAPLSITVNMAGGGGGDDMRRSARQVASEIVRAQRRATGLA